MDKASRHLWKSFLYGISTGGLEGESGPFKPNRSRVLCKHIMFIILENISCRFLLNQKENILNDCY